MSGNERFVLKCMTEKEYQLTLNSSQIAQRAKYK
jgi:hypothetical protein